MPRIRTSKPDGVTPAVSILPSGGDPYHYRRMVPQLASLPDYVLAADAALADLEAQAATVDERHLAAQESGDEDGLLKVMRDRETLPTLIHFQRVRAQKTRAVFWASQAARIYADPDMRTFREKIDLLVAIKDAVGLELQAAISASVTGETVYLSAVEKKADAENAAARLQAVDPKKIVEPVWGMPKVEPMASPDPGMGLGSSDVAVQNGVVVGVNGRARYQMKRPGEPLLVDGYRVRADGFLIDDNDRIVDGKPRRPAVYR